MLTRRVNTQRRTLLAIHRAPAPSPLQEQEVNTLHRSRSLTQRFEGEHVRLGRDVRSTLCLMLTRRVNTQRRRLLATSSARTPSPLQGQEVNTLPPPRSLTQRFEEEEVRARLVEHAPDSNTHPIQTRARFKRAPDSNTDPTV